jgi:glycosyltransferase involved in cell wall biosynthesis
MKLKVVHFSTGHAGGAGLAARRLNEALNRNGVSSSFFALAQRSYVPNQNEFSIKRNVLRRISSILLLKLQQNFSQRILFSTFSSNARGYRFFKSFQDSPETILHFHNWANLISERNLLKLSALGINVVITAHDERIATGGCHYKFECKQISSGCASCPLVESALQKKLIASSRKRKDKSLAKNHHSPWIVSPSNWIQGEIKSSGIFRVDKMEIIPNTLGPKWNDNLFVERKVVTDRKVTIGIASMSTTSYVKAGDIVAELLDSEEIKNIGFEFLILNQIPQQDQFRKFWQEIACLLALTRADNSPNVIWEALSLRIPVISVNLGGIPEIGNANEIYLLPQAEDAPMFLKDLSDRGAKHFILNTNMANAKASQNSAEIHKNLYLKILSQDLSGENKF